MRIKRSHILHEVKVIIDKTSENESSTNNDFKGFNDQLDRIDTTINESENLIESRTFEIASGGLVVSLTILSLLRDTDHFPEWGMTPTIIIWSIFTLSIILHYCSQFAAKRSAENMSDLIIKKMNSGDKYDYEELNETQSQKFHIVRVINTITPILLIIGTISLIVFTCYCFCNQ